MEARELLSVTATQLLGTVPTGTVLNYAVDAAGISTTITDTVVGPATFNGNSCTETQVVTTATANGVTQTTTVDQYFAQTADGYVSYGTTGGNTTGKNPYTTLATYDPPLVSYPPSMSAGQTTNISSTETITITTDGVPSTTTESINETVTLTSESKQSVTVPAGTFDAYVLTTTNAAASGSTTIWVVPGLGVVKVVSGTVLNEVLSSYSGGDLSGGGGGGGGGTSGGTATLATTIAKNTLPASVVAGGTSHGTEIVDITNSGTGTYNGKTTVNVYASNDGAIDGNSTLIGTVTRKVVAKAGATVPVSVPIKSLPASLNGTYTLLAQETDASGNTASSTTGPTLTAAAPFVSFSETLVGTTLAPSDVSGQKTKARVQIKVTNSGNIVSKGESTVAIYVSPDTSAADGTLVRSVTEPIALKPSASRVVTLPLLSLPAVANGNYYLVMQVTDPTANVTAVASSTQYALAAPFISLVPSTATVTVAKNGSATVSFTVTNNGNITPTGNSTVTIYASTDGTLTNAAAAFTQKVSLRLAAGKARVVKVKLTAAEVTTLQSAAAAILQVTDPLGGSQTLAITI